MVDLFTHIEGYYLFLDESGTPEMSDLSEQFFVLSCLKIENHYYDQVFRKEILKFKKKHKIQNLVLHSSDIRKTRKNFSFLLNPLKREQFLIDLSNLITKLDFEVYYFSVDKKELTDLSFDIYWHALREILLMVKNNLSKTNKIVNIFCESRNADQNNNLSNVYKVYFQELSTERKFKACFPSKLDFRKKDSTLYEISGLEIADLTAFPILNFTRNKVNQTVINKNLLENYRIVKGKITKNYHYNLHKQFKKLPMGADNLT
jgi:hypothetical protein